MTAVLQNVLESRFSTATTRDQKVLEAAKIFSEGVAGHSHTAKAVLVEAFTTSDFPVLLGDAFEREARAHYQNVNDEFAPIVTNQTVADFRKKKLIDVFSDDYFEKVEEGEEYKSTNPLRDTEIEFGVDKYGRNFALTWERMLNGDFSDLVDFPRILGVGGAKLRNRLVAEQLITDGQLNDGFFTQTDTAALGYQSLRDAKQYLVEQENHHEESLDISSLVLVVPQAQEDTARALVEARRITETFDDNGTIREVERGNPLAGIQVVVSREWGKRLDSSIRHSAWALLPGGNTENPTLVRATLVGHPEVDIRVKRDQGERVGGGQVGYQEGSFDNDTIWYRGRSVLGAAPAFNFGSYASTGAA